MGERARGAIPDVSAYLARIGIACAKAPSPAFLDELVYAHQCAVPFENLDVYDNRIDPPLDIATLFDKVVTRRRGGYCFELNALFGALLAELGFDVRPCMARVTLRGRSGAELSHRANIVSFADGPRLADVGFGGPSPGFAPRLEDGFMREKQGCTFVIRSSNPSWWDVSYLDGDGAERDIFSACDVRLEEHDFDILSYYQSQNPNTPFTLNRIVNLKTEDGSRSIRNMTYTEHAGGAKTTRELRDAEELNRVLAEEFGIRDWR